jgi:hypothetical protein
MMHCKENPQLRLPCRIEDLLHMRNAVVGIGNGFDAGPDLLSSEMKSLYGSITSSAVMPLSYVEVFTAVSSSSSPSPF